MPKRIKKVGTCKLCLIPGKKLSRSHIYPEFLYRDINLYDPATKKFNVVTKETFKKNEDPKAMGKGFVDDGILCSNCETIISKYETYAKAVLFDKNKNALRKRVTVQFNKDLSISIKRPVLNYYGIDYAKMKLFFLSMLWRASITTLDAFKNISLGKYGEQLRKMILNCDAGKEDEFQIALFQKEPSLSPIDYMTIFEKKRLPDVSGYLYQIVFGGSAAFIKISNNVSDDFFKDYGLKKNVLIITTIPATVLDAMIKNALFDLKIKPVF